MKINIISGVSIFILGLLIALGPHFLFKVCETQGDFVLQCFWAARAEISTGLIIAVLGIFLIIFSNFKIQLGLTISIFLAGLATVVIPMELFIGGCRDLTAACRTVAFPALTVIGALVIIGAVVYMIYLERKTKS